MKNHHAENCVLSYKDQTDSHYPSGLESDSKEMKNLRNFLSENGGDKIEAIFSNNEEITKNIINYLQKIQEAFNKIFGGNARIASQFDEIQRKFSCIGKEDFGKLLELQKYLYDLRKQYSFDYKKATNEDNDYYKDAILHGWIKFFDKGIIRGFEKSLMGIEDLEDDGKSGLDRKEMPKIEKLFAVKIKPEDVNQVKNGDC